MNRTVSLSFDKVRETDSFDEILNVKNFQVCMLTFANEDYYLNVSVEIDEVEGKYKTDKIQFQRFTDLNKIDFNGYWIIEVLPSLENNICLFKHLNTGLYLAIINDPDVEEWAELTSEVSEMCEFEFEAISQKNSNIYGFTQKTVFKIIQAAREKGDPQRFLRIENENDQEDDDEDDSQDKAQKFFKKEGRSNTKRLIIDENSPLNFDTYNLMFPQQDEYLELIFCIDTNTYLE